MKAKIFRSILALSLMLGLLSGMLIAAPVAMAAGPTTWYVHDGEDINDYTYRFGAHWFDISPGDTVFVYGGTYRAFEICKENLTVIGEGPDVVTVDCSSVNPSGDSQIDIARSMSASGVVLDGFKIINSSRMGLFVGGGGGFSATNCIVRNCVFEGLTAEYAIDITGENFTFENNVISNSTGTGAFLALPVSGSKILNNTFIDNTGYIAIWNMYGSSPNGIIMGNNFVRNGVGSDSNTLFYFWGEGSDWKIYLNNFVDNIDNVAIYDGTPTDGIRWNSTAPIEYTYNGATYTDYLGNYWGSAYAGSDANGNGIGDIPYTVPDGLGSDNYPLMGQYGVAITEPAPAPTAAFTSDVQSGVAPLTVHFTDQSTNTPTSWAWDFSNDGTVDSTVQNPSYIYAAGNYTVKLTATNAAGSGDVVKTDYIIVTVAGSSSSLTLNANVVLPVVGIQLDKSSINYGDIKPGHDSAVETVRVTNTGNVAADVTLQVQGNGTDAQSFYAQSLYVNSALYNSSTVLATIAETLYSDVATQLKVPPAWDKTGAQQAVFIFWAEESG